MSASQRKASNAHRKRAKALGLARVEIHAPLEDTALIKTVAEVLRGDSKQANRLRNAITASLTGTAPANAFAVFGSDLPDEIFEGVFDRPRQADWREVEL